MNRRIACAVISMTFVAGTCSFSVSADEGSFGTGALIETTDYSTLDFYDGENYQTTAYAALPAAVDLSQTVYFPSIGNQGGLGACTAFATTYYQFSYEVNRLNNISAKEQQAIYSPKWVYNILNGGNDHGIGVSNAYALLNNFGALLIDDLPYDGVDYTSIPVDMETEKINALKTRLSSFGTLTLPNAGTFITSSDDSDLAVIKSVLNSGKVLTITTQMSFNKKAGYGAYSGLTISYRCYQPTQNAGHAMVIVGYDDNVCCDVNGNGTIEASEKGAFKVANSWGSYENDGFLWVLYDAINKTSANTTNNWESSLSGSRLQAFQFTLTKPTFWYINVEHKDVYYVGEIDISTDYFNGVKIGISRTPSGTVTANSFTYIQPFYSMMKSASSTRSFEGMLFFDFDTYCTPINDYLNGYNWHTNVYTSNSEAISSLFRIVDDRKNEIVGYNSGNNSGASNAEKSKAINTKYGDVDYNGLWGQNDAAIIQNYLAGTTSLSTLQFVLADANQDGRVKVNDTIYILANLEE